MVKGLTIAIFHSEKSVQSNSFFGKALVTRHVSLKAHLEYKHYSIIGINENLIDTEYKDRKIFLFITR